MTEKIRWIAPEYVYKSKTKDWFWYVASGCLALIIIAVLTDNSLLGIFSVVAAIVIVFLGIQKPRKNTFSVEEKGVKAGSRLYAYSEINSFWITGEELSLNLKSKITNKIKIPLINTDIDKIRKILLNYLKEEATEPTFTEIITEKIGL